MDSALGIGWRSCPTQLLRSGMASTEPEPTTIPLFSLDKMCAINQTLRAGSSEWLEAHSRLTASPSNTAELWQWPIGALEARAGQQNQLVTILNNAPLLQGRKAAAAAAAGAVHCARTT